MKCVSYTDSKQKCISETVTVKKWQRMEMMSDGGWHVTKTPQTDPRGTLQGFKTCTALIIKAADPTQSWKMQVIQLAIILQVPLVATVQQKLHYILAL